MPENRDPICICCLRGIMPTVSRKWAICIISTLGRHDRLRFNEIIGMCETLSPRSLSEVLHDLQDHGLVTRQSYHEIPPRVEYTLTDEGRALWQALIPLFRWAKEHNHHRPELMVFSCFQAPDP
ncbi:MAG: helix-turn-helix domain-containing protein [Methanoregulaceae archaeon]